MRLFWDIEANGLLDTISKIHCIWAVDLDTNEEHDFGPSEIPQALKFLESATLLVGHNIIRYDIPAVQKLYPWFAPKAIIRDTLVLARLSGSDLKNTDKSLIDAGKLPRKLHGSDSLEAWGYRVGIHKAQYDGGWEQWSPEMHAYCGQDCHTGVALWNHLKVEEMDPRSVELEHRASEVTEKMTLAGWHFNEEAAGKLYSELVGMKHVIETELVETFGSWQAVDKVFIPKRDNKTLGYIKGVEVTKYKTVTFNPGSRQHIEKKLRELGWEPTEFTPSGAAKLDEPNLLELAEDYPAAKLLVEYLLLQKRLGQIGDGDNGWLKLVDRHGLIHANYNTMGTVTGRASHHRPNIAQVPKVNIGKDAEGNKKPLWGREGVWGSDCRALFKVPDGWSLVGADYEGLELRCLSSFMAVFDKGAYGKVVCDGDIHTVNQEAAGLPSRDNAKTFIYGWLYGAGDAKIGKIVGKGPQAGKVLKQKFLKGLPALAKLRKLVAEAAKKGWLKGLDGRRIPVRAAHAALNSLLQSAGAVICKRGLVDTYDALIADGLKWGWDGDFVIVLWCHDEYQIAVRKGLEDRVGQIMTDQMRKSGGDYNFKCRLDAKYMVGANWQETH